MTRPIGRPATVLAAAYYGAAGLGFLATVLAARWLGSEAFGEASMAIAYPLLVVSFISVKSTPITTRYLAGFLETGRRAEAAALCKVGFFLDVAPSLATLLVVIVSAPFVADRILGMPRIAGLMVLFAACLPPFALASTSSAILSGTNRFGAIARWNVLSQGASFAALFLLMDRGAIAAVVSTGVQLAIYGLGMFVLAAYAARNAGLGRWWTVPIAAIAPLREEMRRSLRWTYLSTVAQSLATHAPQMALGQAGRFVEAGFFRLAIGIAGVAGYPEVSLGQVVAPQLSVTQARGDSLGISRLIRQWTVRWGVPAAAVVGLAGAGVPFLIPPIFGSAFAPMVWGAEAMVVASLAGALFFWIGSFYNATGRMGTLSAVQITQSLVVVTVSFGFAAATGFQGLAIAWAVSKALSTVGLAAFAFRNPAAPYNGPRV